jgi:tubby-related protein 1
LHARAGLDEQQRIIQWKDTGGAGEGDAGGGEDILTRMKDRNMRDLVYLINKPPRWNEQVGAYVLNFNGRVTMASVKNFQLVDPDEQNAVVLQVSSGGRGYVMMSRCALCGATVTPLPLTPAPSPYAPFIQFGRVGKDEFTMDLQYPISPFQAFAVTLSSFDSKIACD